MAPNKSKAADKSVRSTRISLTSEQFQILSLPAHRGVNAIASAGVIEKDPFLDGTRIHLAVFAKMDRPLGQAIGLPARVQTVHVGFVFLRAREGVHDRSEGETKDGDQQHHKRKNGRVAHASDLPLLAPAL